MVSHAKPGYWVPAGRSFAGRGCFDPWACISALRVPSGESLRRGTKGTMGPGRARGRASVNRRFTDTPLRGLDTALRSPKRRSGTPEALGAARSTDHRPSGSDGRREPGRARHDSAVCARDRYPNGPKPVGVRWAKPIEPGPEGMRPHAFLATAGESGCSTRSQTRLTVDKCTSNILATSDLVLPLRSSR